MKRFFALFLTLVLAVGVFAGSIKPPKGFDKKLYDATYALYATSAAGGVTVPRFLCTVTAYQHLKGGYLFIGAGHCTPANPDLQADMTFFIEHGIDTPPQPVELIKAVLQNETFDSMPVAQPIDYALFYLPTQAQWGTIDLGDESSLRIGSKTINVNFSLGLAKYLAPGIVSSYTARSGESLGFFGVQMFMTHGASGSSVVDVKTKKIVGLVIAGVEDATVPAWVEPISVITTQLKTLNIDWLIAHPDIPMVDRTASEPNDMVSLLADHTGRGNSHGGNRGGRVTPPANHDGRPGAGSAPRHEGGRPIDRDTQRRYFGREHCFRPEFYYTGGFYSFVYAGIWFDFEDQWPFPVDDVFIDVGPDGYYYLFSPAHPGVTVQVWIP